jgi:hypothetical protein
VIDGKGVTKFIDQLATASSLKGLSLNCLELLINDAGLLSIFTRLSEISLRALNINLQNNKISSEGIFAALSLWAPPEGLKIALLGLPRTFIKKV